MQRLELVSFEEETKCILFLGFFLHANKNKELCLFCHQMTELPDFLEKAIAVQGLKFSRSCGAPVDIDNTVLEHKEGDFSESCLQNVDFIFTGDQFLVKTVFLQLHSSTNHL